MRFHAGRLSAAAAALLLAFPSAGADPGAAPETPPRFAVGARISAALPMGSVLSDPGNGTLLLDELLTLSIPLQLDAGVVLGGHWLVGAYVQYGWSVFQLGQCDVGQSCSITGLHLGLQALYSFRETGDTPWVGIGTGWEWMFTRYSGPGYYTTLDVGGWEFAILQAGYDVVVSPGWKVGPWISGSVGEFSQATRKQGGEVNDQTIPNKALHGWLQLGVRGSFGF